MPITEIGLDLRLHRQVFLLHFNC